MTTGRPVTGENRERVRLPAPKVKPATTTPAPFTAPAPSAVTNARVGPPLRPREAVLFGRIIHTAGGDDERAADEIKALTRRVRDA